MKNRKSKQRYIFLSAIALMLGFSTPTFAEAPTNYGFYNNTAAQTIPEMSEYMMILSKQTLPDTGDGEVGKTTWYDYTDYTNSIFESGFQRAAFYLELENKSTSATEWILVTVPDYTSGNLYQLGVPNANEAAVKYSLQTALTNSNVYASLADTANLSTRHPLVSKVSADSNGVRTLADQTVILEMWPTNYGGAETKTYTLNGIEIKGSTGNYDYYDNGFSANDNGHGSYQIHLYDQTSGTGQTLFSYSAIHSTSSLGIGSNPSGHMDWTFTTTAGVYDVKTLQIFALPNLSADAMLWTNESGIWSDTSWTNVKGASFATAPNSTSEVIISSGTVTVSEGLTATAGTLNIYSDGAVNIKGTLNVSGGIRSAIDSAVTLSGSLTAGQGGILPSITISGNASLSNSSAETALQLGAITGGAGSSLTLNGTKLSISGPVSADKLTITSGSAVELNGDSPAIFSSALSGAGSIDKTGSAPLVLSGDNSGYTGAFTVSTGSLDVTGPASVPSGLIVKSGAGLNLQIGAGAFSQSDYAALASDSRLESGSYLGVYNATDQTMPLTISGSKNFSKSGAGTLTIADSVNSGFTGATRVFQGALQIGTATQTGNLGGSILIDLGAKAIFNVAAETNQTKTMTNAVSGAGTMVVSGGTLQYSTSSPGISSNVSIENGARLLFDDKVSFRNANAITVDINSGGVLEYNVTSHATDTFYHYSDAAIFSNGKEKGTITITGSGVFKKTGAGTLTAVYNQSYPTYSLSMSEGGWLDVEDGCFFQGGWMNGAMLSANKGSLNLASGTVYQLWDGIAHNFDSLTGGGSFLTSGGGTFTVGVAGNVNSAEYGVNANTAIFNGCFGPAASSESRVSNPARVGDLATGAMDNSMSLVKQGTGTQIMAGDNNYSGTTTVSAGTLQFGNGGATGSIGTGNVSVASGAKLIFNATRNNEIASVLSGAGTITQKGTGSTLTLSNAANTFTGALNVEAGRLTLRSTTNAPSLAATAKINMSSGSELEYVVPTGSTIELGAQSINGNDYTFVKSGDGRLNFGTNYNASKTIFNGGTVSMTAGVFNAQTIDVQSDTIFAAPRAAVANPWTVTMYRWLDSQKAGYATITPMLVGTTGYEIGTNIQVYTGEDGWDNWNANNPYSGAAKNAVPTVWDMSAAGNASITNTTRNYLSEYATLSYTTTIQVLKDQVLDFGGSFDDRCAAYAIKLDADGNQVGDWITLTAMNWTSQTSKVSLEAGTYLLDVRVGDVGGGAYATGTIQTPAGASLGMGVRVNGGSLADTFYYSLDIDPDSGVLGLPDGSIRAASTFAAPLTLEANSLTVGNGVTFTIDNPYTETTAITLKGDISGMGTVALTNSANTNIPFTFDGSTEGSLSVGNNVLLSGSGTIAGDLILQSGSAFNFNLDSDTAWKVGGDLVVEAGDDGLATLTLSSTRTPEIYEFIDLLDMTVGASEIIGIENLDVRFDLPTGILGITRYDAETGSFQAVLGTSASIPEPSTWVLLVLGAAGFAAFRKKKNR